ncbi:MAG: GTPase [Fusobacteriaceae bacterium]
MDKSTKGIKKEILIIGKSGVGKSSFINYLFDNKDLCKTGEGKPVTPKGIYRKDYTKDYFLYDTWGLEANKYKEWENLIDCALNNIENPNVDLPKKEFFDCIFYCISAKSARVEEKEIEIIKKLHEKKENPVIILTNCDIASKEEINGVRDALKKIGKNLKIAEVSSVEEETFTGKKESFGKKKVEEILYLNYIDKLVNFVPQKIIENVIRKLKKDKEIIQEKIDNKTITQEKYNEELIEVLKSKIPLYIKEESEELLESYSLENMCNFENNSFSNSNTLKYIAYGVIIALDIVTTPFLPLTLIASLIDKFSLIDRFTYKLIHKPKLSNHLNSTFENIENQVLMIKEKIREEIINKVETIILCSECGVKLKVNLNKDINCPNCKTVQNISKSYNGSFLIF